MIKFLLFAGLLVGCSQSPAWNHTTAPALGIAKAVVNTSPTPVEEIPCPIKFERNGLCASAQWTKGPTDEDFSEFTLTFWSKTTGEAVNPTATLIVKLFMPDMGHGSSPVTIVPTKDAKGAAVVGSFDITKVYFSMGGHWEVRISLKNTADGTEEKTKFDVNL